MDAKGGHPAHPYPCCPTLGRGTVVPFDVGFPPSVGLVARGIVGLGRSDELESVAVRSFCFASCTSFFEQMGRVFGGLRIFVTETVDHTAGAAVFEASRVGGDEFV